MINSQEQPLTTLTKNQKEQLSNVLKMIDLMFKHGRESALQDVFKLKSFEELCLSDHLVLDDGQKVRDYVCNYSKKLHDERDKRIKAEKEEAERKRRQAVREEEEREAQIKEEEAIRRRREDAREYARELLQKEQIKQAKKEAREKARKEKAKAKATKTRRVTVLDSACPKASETMQRLNSTPKPIRKPLRLKQNVMDYKSEREKRNDSIFWGLFSLDKPKSGGFDDEYNEMIKSGLPIKENSNPTLVIDLFTKKKQNV